MKFYDYFNREIHPGDFILFSSKRATGLSIGVAVRIEKGKYIDEEFVKLRYLPFWFNPEDWRNAFKIGEPVKNMDQGHPSLLHQGRKSEWNNHECLLINRLDLPVNFGDLIWEGYQAWLADPKNRKYIK